MTSKEDRIQRYEEVKREAEQVYQEKILPEIAEPVKKLGLKISEMADANFEELCQHALQAGVTPPLRDFGISFQIYRNYKRSEFFIAIDIFTLSLTVSDECYLTIEALERAIREELAQYNIALEKTQGTLGTIFENFGVCDSYSYFCYFSDK